MPALNRGVRDMLSRWYHYNMYKTRSTLFLRDTAVGSHLRCVGLRARRLRGCRVGRRDRRSGVSDGEPRDAADGPDDHLVEYLIHHPITSLARQRDEVVDARGRL